MFSAAPQSGLVLNASLPHTYEHAPFTGVSLAHVGRIGASTFAVTSGAWPAGVAMAPDGTMSGGPAFGMSHVVVEARDAAGCKATVTDDFPVCRRHGWPAPAAWTKTNYPIGNDGWVNGKSVYLDKEKAALLRPFDDDEHEHLGDQHPRRQGADEPAFARGSHSCLRWNVW